LAFCYSHNEFVFFPFIAALGFYGRADVGARNVLVNGRFDEYVTLHEIGHAYNVPVRI
jgi:hypothetical protein